MPLSATIRYALRALRGSIVVVAEPLESPVRRDFRLDAFGSLLFGIFNGSAVS